MAEIFIVIEEETQSTDVPKPLRAALAISHEDTVTWIFRGALENKNLVVRRKRPPLAVAPPQRSSPPTATKAREADRASGQPFLVGRQDRFEYEIVEIVNGEETVLPWEDRSNGECIKHPVPPPH